MGTRIVERIEQSLGQKNKDAEYRFRDSISYYAFGWCPCSFT
jgi:hypothetical protein